MRLSAIDIFKNQEDIPDTSGNVKCEKDRQTHADEMKKCAEVMGRVKPKLRFILTLGRGCHFKTTSVVKTELVMQAVAQATADLKRLIEPHKDCSKVGQSTQGLFSARSSTGKLYTHFQKKNT